MHGTGGARKAGRSILRGREHRTTRTRLAAALAVVVFAAVAFSRCAGTTPTATTGHSYGTGVKTINDGKLTIGADTAFPPFETMSGTIAEGFDVDLAAAIAKHLGLTSEFRSEKFDTLIPQLKAGGKFDVIMSAMTITAERKKEIDFSDAYIDSNLAVAVRKGSTIRRDADLAGKKVGVQSGTTGETWAKENIKGATIIPFDDTLVAFAALRAGRVAGIINDLPVTAFIVRNPERDAEIVQEIPTGEQYGIGVSKESSELLNALNDALASVTRSGEYARIYRKWFSAEPPV